MQRLLASAQPVAVAIPGAISIRWLLHAPLSPDRQDIQMHQSERTVETRLQALERELTTLRRANRWYRRGCAAALGSVAIGGLMAAASMVPDVVQAKKLEILDEQGKVVVAIDASKAGGQVNLWNAAGHNTMRIGTNDQGGDIAIWNNDGRSVFGAFATPAGAELATWNAQGRSMWRTYPSEQGGIMDIGAIGGKQSLRLSGQKIGGSMQLFGSDGAEVMRASATPTGSELATMNAAGVAAMVVGTDELGDGRVSLADQSGQLRLQLTGEQVGGRVQVLNASSVPVVAMSGASWGGGTLDMFNQTGGRVIGLVSKEDGSARFELVDQGGEEVVMLESINDVGGGFAISDSSGARQVVIGAGQFGGLLNLMNDHGVAVCIAGAAEGGAGGFSIRNERGVQVGQLTVDEDRGGLMTVWDAAGAKSKSQRPK
jgi:hypothetical protein